VRPEFREIAAGAGFTEGPVAVPGGIVFTSINRGMLYRCTFGGAGAVPFAETGGGPNGLAAGAGMAVYVAQNGGRVVPTRSALPARPSIQRVGGGSVEVVSERAYHAPNDLAFGPDGRLWFTDPSGSTKSAAGPQPGRVWALDLSTGEAELILDGPLHPNGLAFGPGGDILYVAETLRRRIFRLRQTAEGWRHDGIFAELPRGEPDGMAFDTAGRLWCAGSDGDCIIVFEPDGRVADVIDLGPSFPTNLCFAGPDLATLVVTVPKGGRVLAAEADVAGLPLIAEPAR
jgi:gluconolactonase